MLPIQNGYLRTVPLLLFCLSLLVSCVDHDKKRDRQISFSTRHLILQADTVVSSIEQWNGFLLLLLENGKMLVLDSAYKRVEQLEKKFSGITYSLLFKRYDTVFLANKDKAYYLGTDGSPVSYDITSRLFSRLLLEDSTYLIYGCCVGEWGGAVFFLHKQTGKTYSYYATCPQQVLQFGKEYVVCNNLAHLSDYMSFLLVKDPTTLFEITDEKLKNHCNWYTGIDSLNEHGKLRTKESVRFYDSDAGMSLVSFPYMDSLYSIISLPKATVLAVHRSNTLVTRDTLLNEKINFHYSRVIQMAGKWVCLYHLTEGSPFAAYVTRGNNSGMIIVDENRVDFLEIRND